MRRFFSSLSLFGLFYSLSLFLLTLLSLPYFLYSFFVSGKYRESLPARLGFFFPIKETLSKKSIWIHAVSVGETRAIISLARRLKQRFPNDALIISSITETGHQEALRSLPFADYHLYLPFDFRFLVTRVIAKTSPALVLLSETDFWYHFLEVAKKQGAVIGLVNGKISARSAGRMARFRYYGDTLFSLFDFFCVQTEVYKERFLALGVPSKKVEVTGNLKFDDENAKVNEEGPNPLREKLRLLSDDLILTIGSTHHPEESYILDFLGPLFLNYPHLKILLVPRHPERFEAVAHLLAKSTFSWGRHSSTERWVTSPQIILIDRMGLLRHCYALSDIAIVGGSFFDGVGGHNVLEPSLYGVPSLFGPFMYNQSELREWVVRAKAGFEVEKEKLFSLVNDLLANREKREAVGNRGRKLIEQMRGSTLKTMRLIELNV